MAQSERLPLAREVIVPGRGKSRRRRSSSSFSAPCAERPPSSTCTSKYLLDHRLVAPGDQNEMPDARGPRLLDDVVDDRPVDDVSISDARVAGEAGRRGRRRGKPPGGAARWCRQPASVRADADAPPGVGKEAFHGWYSWAGRMPPFGGETAAVLCARASCASGDLVLPGDAQLAAAASRRVISKRLRHDPKCRRCLAESDVGDLTVAALRPESNSSGTVRQARLPARGF